MKKALLHSKQAGSEIFSGYPEQIYPAELYSALIKAGYQPLDGGYDFEGWKEAYIPSPDIIEILEDGRLQHASLKELDTFLTKATQSLKEHLDRELYTKDADLLKLVFVLESVETSLLDMLHNYFEWSLRYLEAIERIIQERPKNWRDKLHYRDAVIGKTEIATSHYLSTLNFVGVFMNVLAGEKIHNRALQLQKHLTEGRYSRGFL